MNFYLLPIYYLYWHYSQAYLDLLKMCRNLVWFIWNFFSVPVLLKTLFSPWKRLQEENTPGFHLDEVLGNFLVNIIMRLVGLIIRTVFVLFGVLFSVLSVFLGVVIFIIWSFLPVVVVFMITYGLVLILK